MIGNLIEFFIKNRVWVIIFFILVALCSVFAFKNGTIDAIPDIGENQQVVFSSWPGRSPADIEEQVTYPLSMLMQGIPGVKEVRGTSAFGFSIIYMVFKEEIDFYWGRTRILEKLASSQSVLPEGVSPFIGPDATGLGQVFWYTVENKKETKKPLSLSELRSIQDWYVKYQLQSVEGVSEVASVGGFVKEYQIDVDPLKLFARDLHFSAIIHAVKSSNTDVGAEVIEEGDREMIIRGLGFLRSVEDIEHIVISTKNGIPIRVGDVARVQIGSAFRRGILDKNGQEVAGGVVTMRYGENPKIVIDRVKERIKEIVPGLPPQVQLLSFYDRTEIIESVMGTVYQALTQEVLITICVVLFFLLHIQSSLLISLTLPFGVGVSFILMYLFKIDSNIMSLAGLVIAIGTLVDMGIIMTENIYSHLSQNPSNRIQAITNAAREVGPAILTAVMTTIITFFPVFALEGAEGKLFTPLAWAKTLALMGSVFVALALIPALSVYFLKGNLKPIEKNKVSTLLLKLYEPALRAVLENKKKFALIPCAIIIVSMVGFTRIGSEFMPQLNEGDILYMPVTTPDVSITKARKLLAYTDKTIHSHPLVEFAVGKSGRADTALDPAPVAMLETVIRLKDKSVWPPGKSIYDIIKELDGMLQIPGLINSWDFPIQTRIGMISTGIKTQVGIKIFGDDIHKLEKIASEVAREVETIDGAYGVYAEQITGKPYIEFDIDRIAASRYGINTGVINNILQTAVGGMAIGQIYNGRERSPIRVRYQRELRDSLDELKRILIPSPSGQHIPIKQLADIRMITGPAAIQSENGLLRSVVLLNVRDRDIIGFVDEAKELVREKIELPPGYSIQWAGQHENQIRASRRLMILVPLSLLINLFILYIGLKSFRDSFIVFTAIPVALSGGVLLLWAGGFNTSVAVWVGFIALFGIAVDHGVVMITFLTQALKKKAPQTVQDVRSAVLEAGAKRMRPLVMTTSTTIIALLPVMWATGIGSEVMKPMAIPIMGGMLIVIITLFIVPSLFCHIEEKKITKSLRK